MDHANCRPILPLPTPTRHCTAPSCHQTALSQHPEALASWKAILSELQINGSQSIGLELEDLVLRQGSSKLSEKSSRRGPKESEPP
eukprot:1140400-Pelagomonas_calceolata.AAC.3